MSDIFICETEKLEKQGVKVIKIEKEYRKNGEKHTTIEVTSELDFSEHDKVFDDKIEELKRKHLDMIKTAEKHQDKRMFYERENKELKQRIAELESKESAKPMRIEFYADNAEPFAPLEIANSLINQDVFKVDELKELAEHLQVYCSHHNDRDVETISF